MKKFFSVFACLLIALPMFAQVEAEKKDDVKDEGYKFTVIKEIPVTPVKTRAVPAPAGAIQV